MASGRPRIPGLTWNWRYALGLSAGLATVVLASGYVLGAVWLIAIAAVGLAGLAAGLARAPSRRRLIARAWCVVTPRRVRTGCRHAGVQTRDGRLPVVLYTTPAAFGERVTLWCWAGITAGDLIAAREVLRAACWASDVHVIASARYPRVVMLEVIRRVPARPAQEDIPAWPGLNRDGEAGPGEPALFGGRGSHWPFG